MSIRDGTANVRNPSESRSVSGQKYDSELYYAWTTRWNCHASRESNGDGYDPRAYFNDNKPPTTVAGNTLNMYRHKEEGGEGKDELPPSHTRLESSREDRDVPIN